jgi:hypothetical protein
MQPETTQPPDGPVAAPLQQAADTLLALRGELAELAKREEAIRKKMATIEQAVLAYMRKHGLSCARVDGALFYTEVQRIPYVVDWQAFHGHVIETQNLALLQRRLSPAAVREYLDDTGAPPPGVDVMAEIKLRTRSS